MIKIQRALISVSDKTGLEDFAGFLNSRGVEILSTGGTLKALQKANIPAIPVENYTGFPEILDGRVKTLHPKIHAGLLGIPGNPDHKKQLDEHNLPSIDLLVVNLYPFVETLKKPGSTPEDIIENIDIGGPSMLRSGAKNYQCTAVVTEINDYQTIQQEMTDQEGCVTIETSRSLAATVFASTALYDSAISSYFQNILEKDTLPDKLTLGFTKKQALRYGENPHQKAAFYQPVLAGHSLTPLQGKELSFNNMLDFDAAFHIAGQLPENAVAIIKHLNPCGLAAAETALQSFQLARRTDPISAFGSVIGINADVDEALATAITENFVEGVIARKFSPKAREIFAKKAKVRLLEIADFVAALQNMDYKSTHHGLLVQEMDLSLLKENELKIVSKKQPTKEELEGLKFAWQAVKFIKSNAIVYTDTQSTLGVGAGQMSRVDSVELAVAKAGKIGISLKDSFVGSDAFFPFRDGIDAIAATGAKAVIQPGGSMRDGEVIEAADEHGLIMVFTGMRHFRH